MSKLSVIVPIYNMEKYINRCVDSLLAQTLENIEIILVNDGSTDRTAAILDEYRKIDNRIKVINKPNGGVSSAWIEGVKIADGEYIGFMDPDDYCDLDYYEKLHAQANTNDADIVVCGLVMEDEKGSIINKMFPSDVVKNGCYTGEYLENLKKTFYSFNNTLLPSKGLKIIKSALVKNNLELYDKRIAFGDDMGITLATFFDAKKVIITDYFGYHYVIRNNSLTHKFSEKYLNDLELLYKNITTIAETKGYSEKYVINEITRQVFKITGFILFSDDSKSDKIQYLKKLRKLEVTCLVLKGKVKVNFKSKIVFVLLKLKMYRLLLFLASLRMLK